MRARIDHLLIAVPDIEAATRFWTEVIGLHVSGEYTVEIHDGSHVYCRVLEGEGHDFTIVLGQGVEEWSEYTRKMTANGPVLHHIATAVADIDAATAELKAKGVPLMSDRPVEAEGLRQIFTQRIPATGVVHEIIQRTDGRRGFASDNIRELVHQSLEHLPEPEAERHHRALDRAGAAAPVA